MNRIVREHYPAARLPEDLREGLKPEEQVRVTIESASDLDKDISENAELVRLIRRPERVLSLEEMFAMRRPVFSSIDEINDHIRALRDEWG
ncbi:hypothetical protein RZS28_12375 [Methylocapsa polymorpha]|uniref:Uncharacterized protein n=1 Tax=Methylocapsa polymorpha TaxID=3080828 RepID=A0ABZ0HP75_9HYPH|nr:hypothetical protein RZS28_12375 [Methylocapsa sp. RX1]